MKKQLGVFILPLFLLTLTFSSIQAKTPDGQTPSEETICDQFQGKAFGLCNAYCEAMDCDSDNHKASDQACDQVLSNFMHLTYQEPPCLDKPCEFDHYNQCGGECKINGKSGQCESRSEKCVCKVEEQTCDDDDDDGHDGGGDDGYDDGHDSGGDDGHDDDDDGYDGGYKH